MSHLHEERMHELGLCPTAQPSQEESDHLVSCPQCASELCGERNLTILLAELPVSEPPAGFVATTAARFRQAHAKRQTRYLIASLVLAFAAGLMVATATATLVLFNAGMIVRAAVTAFAELTVAARALAIVLGKVPAFPALVLVSMCVMALFCSLLIGRLAVATTVVKS